MLRAVPQWPKQGSAVQTPRFIGSVAPRFFHDHHGRVRGIYRYASLQVEKAAGETPFARPFSVGPVPNRGCAKVERGTEPIPADLAAVMGCPVGRGGSRWNTLVPVVGDRWPVVASVAHGRARTARLPAAGAAGRLPTEIDGLSGSSRSTICVRSRPAPLAIVAPRPVPCWSSRWWWTWRV